MQFLAGVILATPAMLVGDQIADAFYGFGFFLWIFYFLGGWVCALVFRSAHGIGLLVGFVLWVFPISGTIADWHMNDVSKGNIERILKIRFPEAAVVSCTESHAGFTWHSYSVKAEMKPAELSQFIATNGFTFIGEYAQSSDRYQGRLVVGGPDRWPCWKPKDAKRYRVYQPRPSQPASRGNFLQFMKMMVDVTDPEKVIVYISTADS
jgi:hypothetical protein